ncbi:MAG: type IV toxin-antitoxin system AbiEi family antitoxin [Sediminibacterium sp.]
MDITYKTLSTQSAEVIRYFTELDQPAFTMQEAVDLLKDSSQSAVKKLMRDMVTRGLLLRLKDGVYWIIPYEQNADFYFPNTHLVAPYLVGDAKYYIGYYSALEIHSLITQPSMQEQIVVNRQIKPASLTIKNKKFRFIYHASHHFFGHAPVWIDSFHKVQCSDLEKTLVDCLYKPDYAGGISEIAKALFKTKDKIDYPKLLEYCKMFRAQSVIKRLGFLMEMLNIHDPVLEELQHLKTPSAILLEPSYEKKGKLNSKWSILQNIEQQDILSPIFS